MNDFRKKTKTILAPLLAALLILGTCLFPLGANAEAPEDDDYPEELKSIPGTTTTASASPSSRGA